MHELKGYFLIYNPTKTSVYHAKTKPELQSFIDKNNITASSILAVIKGRKLSIEVKETLKIK